ncbi:30S ribosomal protein S21 [Bacteroides ovatus]|nr:30S ribosomal protein S21 [Bacteroides ovatus]
MREVTVRKGEPIDRALKRLKTKLDVEGILDEMARSASKRNKVKWRFSNKSEETASETAETPASAPEA